MKLFILASALFFMCQISFAQYENFDLSKYKLPEIKRHQLDFTFNTSGASNWRKDVYDDENEKNKNFHFDGGVNLYYSFYLNSPMFQNNFFANTSLSGIRMKSEQGNETTAKTSDFNSDFEFNYDVNYYPGNQNWFLTVVPSSRFVHTGDRDFIEDVDYRYTSWSSSLGLGGGKGRIEEVQDFRHAILLLREFEKRNVSQRAMTEEEVYEIAQLISSLKNKRFFDARYRKQEDLTAVDSFLVAKGVVTAKKDINYFVGLEDIWEYGGLQIRESGSQLKWVITPQYQLTDRKQQGDSRFEIFRIISSIGYTYKKPINLKWQTGLYFNLVYYYTDVFKTENIGVMYSKNNTSINTSGNIAYYPNTRTRFLLAGSFNIHNNSEDEWLDKEGYSCQFWVNSSAYYYISERLRLNASIGFNSSKTGIFNDDIENSFSKRFSYNVSLNYAIF